MAQILPNPTDTLGADNHALMHQVYSIDGASPSGALFCNGTGNLCVGGGTGTSPATALDVYGDIVGSGQTWSNYSSTSNIVGINPTINSSIYTKKIGKTVMVSYQLNGVVSGTSVSFGVPYIAASAPPTTYFNNSAYVIASGTRPSLGYILASSTTVTLLTSASSALWVAGTAGSQGEFWYQGA